MTDHTVRTRTFSQNSDHAVDESVVVPDGFSTAIQIDGATVATIDGDGDVRVFADNGCIYVRQQLDPDPEWGATE